MPQGNGSPPVWRWPPAFRGESQLHATGSGAWWQGGDGAAVGIMQQRGTEAMRRAEMEVWRTERMRCRSGRNENERVEGGGDVTDLSSISHSIKFIKFN